MVKINEQDEQPARVVREPGAGSWRYSNRPPPLPVEPKGLHELEQLVSKKILKMHRYTDINHIIVNKVTDLIRCQYNLNFMIICNICGKPHMRDKLIAPER